MKAILVKKLPATDTKPSRWKAIAEGVPHQIFGTYTHTPEQAALALCESHGWGRDLVSGYLPNGDHVFCFLPKPPEPAHHGLVDGPPEGFSYYGPGPLKTPSDEASNDILAISATDLKDDWESGYYGDSSADTGIHYALRTGSAIAKANGLP